MAVSKNSEHECKQDVVYGDDAKGEMERELSRKREPSYFAAIPAAADDKNQDINFSQRVSSFKLYGELVPSGIEAGARASSDVTQSLEENPRWQRTFVMAAVHVLWCLDVPLAVLGQIVELIGNIWVANGGLFRSIWRLFLTGIFLFQKWFLVIPAKESKEYRSIIGLIDSRTSLFKEEDTFNSRVMADSGVVSCNKNDIGSTDKRSMEAINPDRLSSSSVNSSLFPEPDHGSRSTGDVMVMAAKLAYENEAVCRKVVSEDWGMNFVKFFSCWNAFQNRRSTQVFLFTEKPKNAKAIVIAWRGTEPFNAYDWSTDIDISWHDIEGLGRVHIGFLEALGLVDRNNSSSFYRLQKKTDEKRLASPHPRDGAGLTGYSSLSSLTPSGGAGAKFLSSSSSMSGLSQDVINDLDKQQAYDAVSATVRSLLVSHPEAKLYITGHSLGGALAALYTAMLIHNEEIDLAPRIASVYTFGQPRVGDKEMAKVMTENLRAPTTIAKRTPGAQGSTSGLNMTMTTATATATATSSPVAANKEVKRDVEDRNSDVNGDGASSGETAAAGATTIGYYRVVYRNDVVPRVPFDDPLFNFHHWGDCFYFNSFLKYQTPSEIPNKNFFRVGKILVMHFNAAYDLFQNLFLPPRYGPKFQESLASILYRALGLWLPGIGDHSPVNYVNAMRLGSPAPLVFEELHEIKPTGLADVYDVLEPIKSDLEIFAKYVQCKLGLKSRKSNKIYPY